MNDDLITLTAFGGDTIAQVLPRRGFNCISLRVLDEGTELEALWTAPDFVSGQARPASSGIPILFPFPGRLGGTSFEFEGRRYELEAGDALGNAIHGFVLNRPWPLIERSDSHVVGRFVASKDAPEVLSHWPADFQLTATYRVTRRQLSLFIVVENVGSGPLPFGLGLHPYFRVPLGGADAAQCRITVPVDKCWELKDMLPTGKMIPAAEAGLPRDGVEFGQAQFDHVFTALRSQDDTATATIRDPASGRSLKVTFDDTYRECVLYTPGHR
ncbi:MAG: aldose 1-epimerase, partial [Planctomycetia bacterium]|nr:aldose 1-epimerase [Planctomycetia bacterium]